MPSVLDTASTEAVTGRCPYCGALLELAAPVQYVEFPSRAEAVLELVRGRLNTVECPVSGHRVTFRVPLFVFREPDGPVALFAESESLREDYVRQLDGIRLRDHPDDVQTFAELDELRATVEGWLLEQLAHALAPLFGASPPRVPGEQQPWEDRLVLLALAAQARGWLPPAVQSDPPMSPDDARAFTEKILVGIVEEFVQLLFYTAFHGDGLPSFLGLVEEQLPALVLTNAVLEAFRAECLDVDASMLERPTDMDAAFRAEYKCAVVHVAADVPNPRARQWADLQLLLFLFSRRTGAQVDDKGLLDASVLSRTIRFEDAWDASRILLEPGQPLREWSDDVGAWFEHIGMSDRFEAEWEAAPIHMDLPGVANVSDAELVDQLLRGINVALKQLGGIDDAQLQRRTVATFVRTLVRAGLSSVATELARRELDRLVALDAMEDAGWLSIRVCSALNDAGLAIEAQELLLTHVDTVLGSDITCELRFGLHNELGNVSRYRNRPADAIEEYLHAGDLLETCDGLTDADASMLMRNLGIVLRDAGHFADAVRLLEEVESGRPDDRTPDHAALCVNIARTYLDANVLDEGLRWAVRACEIPLSRAYAPTRIGALLARTNARAGLYPEAPLSDLTEAAALAAPFHGTRLVVAASALHHARFGNVAEDDRSAAEQVAEEALGKWDGTTPSDGLYSAGVTLAEWRRHEGNLDEARTIVNALAVGDEALHPWQLSHLRAVLVAEDDPVEGWRLMRLALQRLDDRVPKDGGTFAAPWLATTSTFQNDMVSVARAALGTRGIDAHELLDVFEFLNGREIRVFDGAWENGRRKSAWTLWDEIAHELVASETSAVVLAFLEQDERVDVLCLDSSSTSVRITRGPVSADDLRHAAQIAAQALGPTCVLPRHADAAQRKLTPLLEAFGEFLAEESYPGTHVCILPSPSMLGLPLHAATFASGGLLLERNSVSMAPNLRTLHNALGASVHDPDLRRPGMFVVLKEGDTDEFVARARDAAAELEEILHVNEPLSGTGASKEAVLELLARVDQIVVLAHGIDAGAIQGRGICVSDGRTLPRAPLPVAKVPELRRFVIDAGDIRALERTPALVMSIACSSGRSIAGRGGTRVGLESALFSGGTRTLVAPLWDVDQESALDFATTFVRTRRDDPASSLGEAHRRACLEIRDRHPSLYHWAPFALRGSWI